MEFGRRPKISPYYKFHSILSIFTIGRWVEKPFHYFGRRNYSHFGGKAIHVYILARRQNNLHFGLYYTLKFGFKAKCYFHCGANAAYLFYSLGKLFIDPKSKYNVGLQTP